MREHEDLPETHTTKERTQRETRVLVTKGLDQTCFTPGTNCYLRVGETLTTSRGSTPEVWSVDPGDLNTRYRENSAGVEKLEYTH